MQQIIIHNNICWLVPAVLNTNKLNPDLNELHDLHLNLNCALEFIEK